MNDKKLTAAGVDHGKPVKPSPGNVAEPQDAPPQGPPPPPPPPPSPREPDE